MRWYKIVACNLLMLSVFSFVLAAPVAVQEVREACADVVDGGENVIIRSGKRAETHEEEDPKKQWLAPAQQEPSSWDWRPSPLQHQGSSSTPNYASGTHPNPSSSSEDEAKLIQPAISTKIQLASSKKAKSVSWAPSNEVLLQSGEIISEPLSPMTKPLPPPPGREGYLAKMATQQSPSSQIEPASLWSYFDPPPPSGREGYLAKMAAQQSPSPEIEHASSLSYLDIPSPPGREGDLVKTAAQQSSSSEIEPTSSSSYINLPPPPGREGYLAKMAAQQSPSPEIKHASSSSYLDLPSPPRQKGYLAEMAALQSPSPEIDHASSSSYFDLPSPPGRERYLAKMAAPQSLSEGPSSDSVKVLSEFDKLKFRPRFRRISGVARGAVDAAQRELNG